MMITTHIDLTPITYRFFLRQAKKHDGKTPEDMIALFLEAYVKNVIKEEHD